MPAALMVALGVAVGLAGCGGGGPAGATVPVTAPTPTGRMAQTCAALVVGSPARVAGAAAREVRPSSRFAAAWGDPAIVLTCGGARPPALRPGSQCFGVDGVDWLATRGGREVDPTRPVTGPLTFTTIGRSAYVAVRVPAAYQPAANALIDLTPAVKAHTRVVHRCR